MDWNKIETWHWFCAFGGLVLLIGIVMYFLPAGKIKVPGVITAAFGALGVGLAAGIIFMAGFGYKPVTPPPQEGNPEGEAANQGSGPMPTMPGMPKGKTGGAPKGKGGFGGFGGPPSPKVQLTSLVTSLETLVDKPVALNLSPEDRAAIMKELQGLDTASEIKDDEAKAKLEAIEKVLEKNRKALETVGYRWSGEQPKGPGGKGGFGKDPPPNPFKEGTASERLKALMERLNKK
jgi:hypothetical protein